MPDILDGAPGFHALLAAQPRLTTLVLSPDGNRLVVSMWTVNGEGNGYASELWEVDPTGHRESRRLTRSAQGEFSPAFAADGRLLFLSARENTDPSANDCETGDVALWVLPDCGEAEQVTRHPGGISAFTAAMSVEAISYTAALLPGATDADAHARLRRDRQAAKVTAILYETGPTRSRGTDLGPEEPHTFVRSPDGAVVNAGSQGLAGPGDVALSADGALVAYTRAVSGRLSDQNTNVVVIADAATGAERRTFSRPGHQYLCLALTTGGTKLVCQRQREETYEAPWRVTLVAFDLASGEETDLLPEFDNWPWPGRPILSPVPGDDTVWFTGDERGHCPVFRRDPDGTVTRLTSSGAYSCLRVAPDGSTLYALRSAIDSPPRVVRLDAAEADQQPAFLNAPGDLGPLPGTMTEVHTTADDGLPLRAWLVLPQHVSADHPAPLIVLPHGGPQYSWTSWTWWWSPWSFAARGYAVLLPDPALSTGYGQRMQERGLRQWGGQPYRDVMALTDATQKRDDIDATRTGLAGHSYGGYIANRAATLTNRFKAIICYAGTWNLETLQAETDLHAFYHRIFGDPRTHRQWYQANSPHFDVANVTTPMLLVHGGKDYRVPVGQALALFQDLQRLELPVSYLYFPDEGHVVEAPNNYRILQETVINFLDHHVLAREWRRPQML